MRLFIAIDLPEEIKQILEEVKAPLKDIKGVKPVKKDNIHLTLKFLGDVYTDQLNEIIHELRKIKFKPFNLHLRGLGCFPSNTRPRIIWIGTDEGSDEVKRLYEEINKKLRKFKFKPEQFKSHVTIIRIKFIDKNQINRFNKILNNLKNEDFGIIPVESFQLKKSVLTPKGPIYTTLEEFNTTN